jgi:hypothetical protein
MNAIRGLVAVIGALAVTRGAPCDPRLRPFPRVLGANNNWRGKIGGADVGLALPKT